MEEKRRYCTYCRCSKPDKGFKEIRDKSGRLRNYKCPSCSSMKKKPVKERDAIAQKARDERKASEARRMKEAAEQRCAGHSGALHWTPTPKKRSLNEE